MSNQWSSGQFQQGLPADAGQVKMFDPTQFQTQTPFGRAQSGKSIPEPKLQNAGGVPHPQHALPAQTGKSVQQSKLHNAGVPPHSQHALPAQTAHSSWDSWGGWNVDDSSNHQAMNNQQQGDDSRITQSQHSFDERVPDSGYYAGIWNRGWNGTDQTPHQPQTYAPTDTAAPYNNQTPHQPQTYAPTDTAAPYNQTPHQPQTYAPTDTAALYNQTQHHHPVHDRQSLGGETFGESDNSSSNLSSQSLQSPQSDVYFGGQFYNPLQPELGGQGQNYNPLNPELEDQGQNYNTLHPELGGQGQNYNPLHSELGGQGQNYNPLHSELEGQGLNYNPLHPELGGQGQNYSPVHGQIYNQDSSHTQPYYDQQHDDSIWTTNDEGEQWADNQQEFPTPEVAGNEHQADKSQNINSDNLVPASNDVSSNSVDFLSEPRVEVYDNDGDGTVSGFLGRDGDGDGDVQLDTQRHIHHDGGQSGDNSSSAMNQFLSVTPLYHRTNSEISNASLSTLNLSISEDDDGQEPLHNIQELVQRMEDIDLARRLGEDRNKYTDNAGHRVTSEPRFGAGIQDDLEPKQKRGDYSGFGNAADDQNSLPLEKNILSSTVDHPDSGESGGSSGLADWEFVSSPTRLTAHNRNSSLDNNVTIFTDKPDGGVSLSDNHESIDQDTKSSQNLVSSTSDPNISSASHRSNPSGNPSHTHTFSAPSESNDLHCDTRGRSGSPFVAAFTDHGQEESLPQRTQMPSQASSLNLNRNTPAISPEDGAASLSKRDVVKSQSRSDISQPPHFPSSSSSLPSLPDSRQAKNSDPLRSQALAATPLKHKLSTSSLTDDGNCSSKRDADRTVKLTERDADRTVKLTERDANRTVKLTERDANRTIKLTETVLTQNKPLDEPPVRSSSRNSGKTSSQQHGHHSAFHAVGRPRQSAISPATTLWDNSEAPAYNILLAPAMPLIIPNLNTNPVSVDAPASYHIPGVSAAEKAGARVDGADVRSKPRELNNTAERLSVDTKDNEKGDAQSRSKEGSRKEDKNMSYDSLDEVDALPEGQRNQSYISQHTDHRDSSYNQDSYRRDVIRRDPDRPASRSDRPSSRNDRPSSRSDRSGHYHYDRPVNKVEDPDRRQHAYYRDYREGSYDERYDRPRSRQEEPQDSRPSSRSVQEVDRPRSRANYEHDRDYYYKDRHRGYGYDNYGRHVDYYDERERYYRYYKEKEARYTRGYYDEYYGAKHADYYYQRQQVQQPSSRESEQSSSRSQSRGSTPAMAPSPAIPPSPGIKTSSGHDYYATNRSSRPDSRTDYNRDYYNRGYAYEGYNTYYDGYGYDPYAYGYTYPTYEEYSQGYNQGRKTPPKYSYPHTRASFGPAGQLLKVLPNQPANGQPAVIELQDVQIVLESCPEADELKCFPGPLTRVHTHKKDVLIYCQQKVRSCRENINMVDRESAQLIWRFLELLIKQNGSVVGTDLADLLLEGHEPSTHEFSTHGVKISQSPEVLDAVPEGNSEGSSSARASPAVRVAMDRTVISSADRERERWVDRFRNLLLYGHKKDALECAMKNNLWGHALFLASKMDARTHANVMTRFANGAIRMNDPLQTLYQLMSGRQPAAVTCVVDERWGDWRPHLAMILSNQTSRQDIDRKSITTLGDTLAARGYLHASHFCYLMAQVNFGSYVKKTSKIVLIGSDHNLPVDEFATNDAVQCTEVYEYAQSLGNPSFCLPHFQVFKYLYACRLADYGMPLEALQYCEVVANNIHQYPSWFHATFVKLVYQLSSKLKFCDPQRQLASEDSDDSLWLQQLEKICISYDDGSVLPLSGTATPAGYPGTTTSSESGDYSSYGYGYRGDATTPSTMSSAPVIGAYGHQLNNADSSGYGDGHDVGMITGEMQNMNVTGTDQQADYSQQQYDYNVQWQQAYGYHYTDQVDQHQQPQQQQQLEGDQTTNQHHQFMQPQASHHQTQLPTRDDVAANVADVGHNYNAGSVTSYHGGTQLDSSSASTQPSAQQLHSHDYGNFEAAQQRQHHGAGPAPNLGPTDNGDDAEDVPEVPTSSFDYFGNVGAHKVVAPPHRYRHMSGSSTGSTSRRRTISGSSTGSVKAAPHKQPQHHAAGGKGFDQLKKNGPQDNGGSGWFGGLFNKFKVKGKNEMILPDDKNPAIVWDPLKKKWTNADGTEEEETSAAPPPKDADLMGKPPGMSSTSGPPPPSINSGGNRFSLKAKGAKNQYVDVTNPKAVTVPHNLFSVMPGPAADASSTAGLNFFSPAPGAASGSTTTEATNPNPDSSSLVVPNPSDKCSRSSSLSSLSQEIQQFMAKPITDDSENASHTQATPSMPMLFNPSNLKSSSTGRGQTPSSSAGPGLKPGQRRAYPK